MKLPQAVQGLPKTSALPSTPLAKRFSEPQTTPSQLCKFVLMSMLYVPAELGPLRRSDPSDKWNLDTLLWLLYKEFGGRIQSLFKAFVSGHR